MKRDMDWRCGDAPGAREEGNGHNTTLSRVNFEVGERKKGVKKKRKGTNRNFIPLPSPLTVEA